MTSAFNNIELKGRAKISFGKEWFLSIFVPDASALALHHTIRESQDWAGGK